MEREEAEQILNMTCRDGTFLVRERRAKPGWFALSVWCPDGIVHVPLGESIGKDLIYSRLSLSRTPRDALKHFEILLPVGRSLC